MNALVDEFGDELFILAVPSNQFALQEPGANSDLLNGYKHVRPGGGFEPKFEMAAKHDVNGISEHAIYTYLKV